MTPKDEAHAKPSRFRKKPVEIEAFQLTNELAVKHLIDKMPLPFGLKIGNANFHEGRREVSFFRLFIETLEGRMEGREGDWIIKGVKGELYPCKPDVFEATYTAARAEPVNAPPQVLVLPEGEWCIERGDSESSKPKYWCGFVFGVNPLNHDGSPTKIKAVVNLWQLDNWMAVRFARKEDALRVRTCIENNEIDRATHRVAYHEWG